MTKADDSGAAWGEVLNTQTTRAELSTIIEAQIKIALVDVLGQIETMDMTHGERLAALALVAPVIREKTAAALTSGWLVLQSEAGIVH